jgi:hypothetical protein
MVERTGAETSGDRSGEYRGGQARAPAIGTEDHEWGKADGDDERNLVQHTSQPRPVSRLRAGRAAGHHTTEGILRPRADAVAQACPARCYVRHEVDILSLPSSLVVHHNEGDGKLGAAALRPDASSEACAVDVQTLGILRGDEAVVLAFIEPEHRAAHLNHFPFRSSEMRTSKTAARIL